MGKASRLAGTMLGSALAAMPTAKATADSEPGNNTFPGESATAGATLPGSLCLSSSVCDFLALPVDLVDFYHYTGLSAGDSFDFLFDPGNLLTATRSLQAGLYTDGSTITDFVTSAGSGSPDFGPPVHLAGTIPVSGELVFGITSVNAINFEGYNIKLTVTPVGVPEPATVMLLAAGVTAVGLGAARRRKRG